MARRRIRLQWALEGATTAAILAAAGALWVIFLLRIGAIPPPTGAALLLGTIAIIAAGAALKAARRIDDETVARRIDRASNLADRLSTAIAFSRLAPGTAPAGAGAGAGDDETHALMRAAIRDGVRAVPRADVSRATPFSVPGDLRAALGFLVLSALAAGLAVPTVDRTAQLFRVDPEHGAAGDEVVIRGRNLTADLATRPPPRPASSAPGAPEPAPATADRPLGGFVPTDGMVTFGAPGGSGKAAPPAIVVDWADAEIVVRIPDSAPLGLTTLNVWIAGREVGALVFTVVDRKDAAYHKAGSVVLEPDDRAYLEALLAELRAVARRDDVPELEDFAKQIEQLLKDAELGKITKEQLLDALAKAEDQLNKDAEPDQAEVDKLLAEMGKELSRQQITKELGDALQKQELDKAKQALEKLAEAIEQQQMSDKDKQQLAEQLDKVAKQMQQKEQQREQKQDAQQKKLEDEIRRLVKKQQDAKTDQERQDIERQLEKKKDELKKLEKDRDEKEQSAQRQALKRLSRDMEKAAENLDKPKQDQQQQDQEQRDQQASQKLKDAARETGRVDQDQRKQATQKKLSSQMDDLREAMRRAKQKGNKGPQDPFGKQGKNQDFADRARGQKGQGQAWKPGQGQRPGQGGQGGQGQGQNGQGNQPGDKQWGTGHDPNLTGDATDKSGNTKDAEVQGVQGKEGGGTRETILSAAQKGFASERYRDVYGKYQRIVEEVMRTEKLPSSYKYYVKRYFAKIHPSTEPRTEAAGEAPAPDQSGPTPGQTESKTP